MRLEMDQGLICGQNCFKIDLIVVLGLQKLLGNEPETGRTTFTIYVGYSMFPLRSPVLRLSEFYKRLVCCEALK